MVRLGMLLKWLEIMKYRGMLKSLCMAELETPFTNEMEYLAFEYPFATLTPYLVLIEDMQPFKGALTINVFVKGQFVAEHFC